MNCERNDQNYIKSMGLPKDSKLIRRGEYVIGITTHDGSLDYTPEGEKFLSSLPQQVKKRLCDKLG